MFTTAATVIGILVVTVLAIGPVVLDLLPDRQDESATPLLAAWSRDDSQADAPAAAVVSIVDLRPAA